jgi:hypothetical protein
MTKHIVAACGIAALSSLTLAAQQGTQPSTASSSSDSGRTVTVTGCLQSWDGSSSTVGRSGTTPARPDSSATSTSSAAGGQFILTNVQQGGSTDSSSPSSSAATSGASSSAAGKTYVLSAGSSGVNLSEHLNHKVQITGTTMAGKSGSTGSGTTDQSGTADRPGSSTSPESSSAPGSSSASGRGTATPASSMPTLSVTSIKMVSANCS